MTTVAYAHPTISRFAIADGMLHIGGLPIGLLAERAGATPFFAFERTGLTRRVEELRRALPDDIHRSYAVKANPMPAVVQHFSRQVDGFDVASAGEMAVALDTPIPADRVSFAGPGNTPAELSRAVAARVTISLESETEALRVAAIGERLGVRPRVAVRVNPDFQVKGSGMRLGGGSQQARIVLELGRFLVGEAGGYVTRVVDRKESRGHTFLVVDGGLHHQLAASGNFGQVIRKNYPVAIANRMGVPGAEIVSVSGACAPRWTCSHVMSASGVPRLATLWRSFRPAPTG